MGTAQFPVRTVTYESPAIGLGRRGQAGWRLRHVEWPMSWPRVAQEISKFDQQMVPSAVDPDVSQEWSSWSGGSRWRDWEGSAAWISRSWLAIAWVCADA